MKQITNKEILEKLNRLQIDVNIITGKLDEGELTDWAKEELAEARARPESENIPFLFDTSRFHLHRLTATECSYLAEAFFFFIRHQNAGNQESYTLRVAPFQS